MLTARSYWCVGRVFRSLYEELARSYALCFRELGMAGNQVAENRQCRKLSFLTRSLSAARGIEVGQANAARSGKGEGAADPLRNFRAGLGE